MSDIKSTLEAEAIRLRTLWDKLEANRRGEVPSDSGEAALHLEGAEVVDQLERKVKADLVAVTGALRRVEDGTYGICTVCEEEIDPRRLAAMPTTDRCTDHAD